MPKKNKLKTLANFKDAKPKTRKPDYPVKLTYALMIICIVVGLVQTAVYYLEGNAGFTAIVNNYGFSTQGFLNGQWWTPITSIFLHGGIDHLILNLIVLYFFGKATEEKLGPSKTLGVFIAGGLAGDIFSTTGALFGLLPLDILTIGASAAIFGLMGVSMILDPLEMIFYPFLIPIPLIFVAVLYGFYNIIAALEIFVTGTTSQIAYLAHLGGLAAGGIIGFHEAGLKKALIALALIIGIVIVLPFLLEYLQVWDYTGLFN